MDEKHVYGNGQKALNIILSAFFLAAVIVIFGSQIFLVVTLRMPKTFREMTMIKYALDFSRGINPYASELLNDDLPFNSGCYGFLQAILTAGILKFVSLKNALLATELLSLGLDMLSALFLYLTLRGRQCERWIALFAATVISLVLYQSGAAYPHSIGMLLLFFTIWLVGKDTRKEKYHPFAYAVLAILSFYAKQYFLIMAPCLFIYLLIRSPKDALKLTIYGIVIGFGSLIAVYFVFPLYLPLTLVRANIDSNMSGFTYVLKQIYHVYVRRYPEVTILASVGILLWIGRMFNSVKRQEGGVSGKALAFLQSISYEGICLAVSIIPVMMISRNHGQYCEYFEQLTIPYACVIGCLAMQRIWTFDRSKGVRAMASVILLCLAAFTGFHTVKSISVKVFRLDYDHFQESWGETQKILDEKAPEHKIIVTSLLADYCMVNHIYTDDYGQAQYNSETALERLDAKPLYDKIFPAMRQIIQMTLDYRELVQKNIDKGYYEVLVLNSDSRGSLNCRNLKVNEKLYEKVEEKVLPTVNGKFSVTTYIRKK